MPDVPTTNIYVEGNFALMSEGVSAVLHSNRIIRIESNRKLQLAGNSTRITVCGPIVGTAPNTAANGIVTTYNPYWKTHVELAPAVNVTNKFGRLLVQKYDLTHGGAGVTEVDQVTSSVEGHAGSFDVWDGATLAVTSGTLRVVNGTWAANCAYVDVRGGLLDTSGIKYEYLNAFRVPGTTTVSRAPRAGHDHRQPRRTLPLQRVPHGGGQPDCQTGNGTDPPCDERRAAALLFQHDVCKSDP